MIPASLKRSIKALVAAGASATVIAMALTQHHEGRRYVAYADPGNGTLTVCDGHTGPDIVVGKRYTDPECDALLARDMAIAEAAVDRLVTRPIGKLQKAALMDFVFNKGAGALARSTLLRLTNAGRENAACAEYRRWVYAGGRKLQGLANRADADAWVCGGAK